MFKLLYCLICYLLTPFFVARLLILSVKEAGYSSKIHQRFGFIKKNNTNLPTVWLHAVSLGETIASQSLVKAIKKQYPNYQIWLTTTTPSGINQINKIYGSEVEKSFICYDSPGVVNRFISRLKPKLLILFEAEIWPNLILQCHKCNIPVIIANARLSARSANRYKKFSFFFNNVFDKLTQVIAQDKYTAARITELGVAKSLVNIVGNIKFDATVDVQAIQEGIKLRKNWQQATKKMRIFAAISTHEDEEEQVLSAFKQIISLYPDVILLLVPRHATRFNQVYNLINNNFNVVRYSLNETLTTKTQVILGDTIGNMTKLLATADIAFVGGSLIPVGGHNVLEPAYFGIPVITGKHVFNFEFICQNLFQAGGLLFVNSLAELTENCISLLTDNIKYQNIAENAKQFTLNNKGSLARHLQVLQKYLET